MTRRVKNRDLKRKIDANNGAKKMHAYIG